MLEKIRKTSSFVSESLREDIKIDVGVERQFRLSIMRLILT